MNQPTGPTMITPRDFATPDYAAGSLLNLVATLEHRLTGSHIAPRLDKTLEDAIPAGDSIVVVLIDGLGAGQLNHPAACDLASSHVGSIDSMFPSTTTVSLATLATGRAPSHHGLLGYQLYLPEIADVAFTIKWTRPGGAPLDLDFDNFLPGPNLWERLDAVGVEPITVQPGAFQDSKMSRVLYRGCRLEPAYGTDELIEATVQLASQPNRLVMTYFPNVDVAAHVNGQASAEYAEALRAACDIWVQLASRLPESTTLVATADHGHVDFPPTNRTRIDRRLQDGLILYGDSRAMFVKGNGAPLADELPARWVPISEAASWWGPDLLCSQFSERAPDGILLADPGHILLHRHTDQRLIGRHGGMTSAERVVPILTR